MRISSNQLQMADAVENQEDDLIEISLPICEVNLDLHADSCDFTINSCVMRFYDIKRILQSDNESDDCLDIDGAVYNKLREALIGENAEYKMNIMRDIRLKLLTSTFKAVSLKSSFYRHFWRTVKFGIRYFDDGWKVNPNIIKWYQQLYGEWMANEQWLKDENMQKVQVKQQFNYGYATNLDEYEKMIKMFDVLHYHNVLKNALKTNDAFRQKWIEGLLKKEQSIVNLFKEHGYPISI